MELGPEDVWPRHPSQCWRETLDYAREHGWRLVPHSGHTFGTLKCESGSCEFKIFSTGRGAENVARQARKDIDKCVHSATTTSALAVVDDLLRKANAMVEAAEAMLAKQQAEDAALLLDEAGGLVEQLAAWDEFGRLVHEIETQSATIANALTGVGADPSTTVRQATETATAQVAEAKTELDNAPPLADVVKTRRIQCRELTRRIEDVRNSLNL
ncbi:hypothetical protein ACIRRA_33770 [Nocardia sp. NPDC101769]|uniref:hypothetical protein n=1 Tax=Nocardia sp. NPDC101769 TaxID=3364333 RepID=UPI003826222C